ncbi:FeoB small GTPase domain-containing protein [Paraclostridium sp. AKS73]|uniref:FeoB small GTPase domain-containing protein n=1 Tax=Paraclostridium sp. AKS73 TaxID=2876116 RepID=UPI002FCCDA9A
MALAGNPNTGKSTVFNYLTGLKQHTGNWPGKTVCTARGDFKYNSKDFALIDLPGTYSLFAASQEEIVARDFACFGNPDAVIVVADATSLERNLNLAFQIMELTDNVILCINLVDEARKKGIFINKEIIESQLGIPVVLTSARSGEGMDNLLKTLDSVVTNSYHYNNKIIKYDENIENLLKIIESDLSSSIPYIKSRWLGLRLIDGDISIYDSMNNYISGDYKTEIDKIKSKLPDDINKTSIRDSMSMTMYGYAKNLYDKSVIIKNKSKFHRDEKLIK